MIKENPWLGLASYEEQDEKRFCGRDKETLDVVRLIENNLFITLYGSSGIGKTSLLRAGVIPVMKRKDYFPLYIRLSQEPKELSYAEAIVRKLKNSGLTEEHNLPMRHPDGNDRLYLWNYFATTRFMINEREVYPVIILDQFEEIFRDEDKTKAELLLKQIYLLLDDELEMPAEEGWNADTNYRFLASIREDFLFVLEDSIDELSFDLYKNNRYRLRAMKSEQARQVVLKPGEGCIEPGNRESIANQIVSLAERNSNNDIDTLLLSLICSEMYNIANQKKTIITKNLIDQLGDDILGSFYGDTISLISDSTTIYLEEHLLTQSGFRNSVAYEDIIHDGIGKDDIEKLVSMRLLCIQRSSGVERVEFMHDAICKIAKKHRDTRLEGKQKRKDDIVGLRFAAITTVSILLPLACLLKNYIEDGDSYFLWMIRKAPFFGLVLVSLYAICRVFFVKRISARYKTGTKYLITGVLSFLIINGFFVSSSFRLMDAMILALVFEVLLFIAYFAERTLNNPVLLKVIRGVLLLLLTISVLNIYSGLLFVLFLCLFALYILYPYCYTKEKNAFWTSFISILCLSIFDYALSISYLFDLKETNVWVATTILSIVVSVYYLFSFKKNKSAEEAWNYCMSLDVYEKHPFFIKYTAFLMLFCVCFIAFLIGLALNDKYTIFGVPCLGIGSLILVFFLLFRDNNSLRSKKESWVGNLLSATDSPAILKFHHLLLSFLVLSGFSISQYLQWHLIWMISLWLISTLIIIWIYKKSQKREAVFKHIILWFVPFVFIPLLCFGYNAFSLPQYARVYKGTINVGPVFRFMKIKNSDGTIGLQDRTSIVIPAEYKRILLSQYYVRYLGGAKFPYSLEKIEEEFQAYEYPENSIPKILFLTIDSEGDNHVWDCSEHLSMNNICSNVILSDYENILKYNPRLGQKGIYKFYLNSLVDRNVKKQDVSKKALLFLNNTLNSVGIEVDAKGKVNYNSIDKVDLKTMLRTIDESSQLFPYLENFSAIEREIIDSIIPKHKDYDTLANRIDYAGIARWRMLSQDYSKAESDARKSLKESSSPYNYAHVPLIESFYFTQQYDSAFFYLDKYLNKECFTHHYFFSRCPICCDTARGPNGLQRRIFLGDAIWQDFQFYKKMGWISDTLSPSYLMLMSKLKDNANNRPYSYALRRGWGDVWGEENSYYYLCQYYNDNEYLTNNDFYQYIMYDNKPVSPCYRRYSYCWPSIDFNYHEYLTQKFGNNHVDDPYWYHYGYSDYIKRTLLVINADNHKRQYIDITNGPPKPIPGSFDHAWLFSEGMAVVAIGDSIGIINTDGEYVIRPSIKCRLKYSKHYAKIENQRDDYYDFLWSEELRNWEYKLPSNTNFVFQHGLCPMVNEQGLYGLIDKNGDWIVEPEYTYIDYLVKGYRIIKKGDKYGLMDDCSNILLPVMFNRINYPDTYHYWASTIIVIDGEEYPIYNLQERIHEIIENHSPAVEDLTFVP